MVTRPTSLWAAKGRETSQTAMHNWSQFYLLQKKKRPPHPLPATGDPTVYKKKTLQRNSKTNKHKHFPRLQPSFLSLRSSSHFFTLIEDAVILCERKWRTRAVIFLFLLFCLLYHTTSAHTSGSRTHNDNCALAPVFGGGGVECSCRGENITNTYVNKCFACMLMSRVWCVCVCVCVDWQTLRKREMSVDFR